jgi:hypothetical protein
VTRYDNNNSEQKEIEIMWKHFENVESFKYLVSLVTDLNEIELRLKIDLLRATKVTMY